MYATLQDMLAKYGETETVALTDREGAGAPDEAVAAAALAQASDEADSYLAGRYAVPVSPVPPVLKAMVCDMARYHLTGGQTLETDPIAGRYKLAIRWLERVASGAAELPGVGQPPSGGSVIRFGTGRRAWSRRVADDD